MKKIICIIILLFGASMVLTSIDAVAIDNIQQYQKVVCPNCQGTGVVATMWGPVYCPQCAGTGAITVIVNNQNNPSFRQSSKRFVKTEYECEECSCDGYWGYYHSNGTYEGKCSNTDRWGRKCNHTPEDHGLRSW